MVVAVVLLWTCGMQVVLPPRLRQQDDKSAVPRNLSSGGSSRGWRKRPQNGWSKSSG